MSKLTAMKATDRVVELPQELQPALADAGADDAPVGPFPRTAEQLAVFKLVEQACHVRVSGDHALADFMASHATRPRGAEDAQDVVLGGGEAVLIEDLLELAHEPVG